MTLARTDAQKLSATLIHSRQKLCLGDQIDEEGILD
jgi:hypothetical protein